MAATTQAVLAESGSPSAIVVAATALVHTVGRLETRPSRSSVPTEAGARVVTALIRELLENKRQLARDIVRLRSRLQAVREHVPGIGLDLEMRRERLRSQRPQRRNEVVLRRAPRPELLKKDRHVTMDPPLA